MAYKFQLGDAQLSGSLTQEGDIIAKSGGDASKGALSASLGLRLPAAATIQAGQGTLNLSMADMLQIDGITAGTVAASKAVVVDSNKDASGFRNVSATGYFEIGSAQLTESELEMLDGITAGTVAASKAMVVDADKDITGGRNITISGELDAASGDFSGNIDVDGTANLDAVDIDGAVQADGTITVGVDDTGYDVKFFGDTASAYMLWDASADDLILAGAAGLVVPDGKLTLNATAVSSTAAELNLLDGAGAQTVVNSKAVIYGASGEVQAGSLIVADDGTIGAVGDTNMITMDAGSDIQIANDLDFNIGKTSGLQLGGVAVTSTAAELNFLDGSELGKAIASKALVVNGDRDLKGTGDADRIRDLQIVRDLTAGRRVKGDRVQANISGVIHAHMSSSGEISGSGQFKAASLMIDATQVFSSARQLQNVSSLDATTEASIESAIDTLANLASMGTADNELEALGSLDIAQGLKIGNTSVISTARQLQNVATLDATTEATIETAIDTLANLSSMGTSGAELEALGVVDVAEGLKMANSNFVDASRNILAGNVTGAVISGSSQFQMDEGDLRLSGQAVTSTAAELNLVDGFADAGYDQTADSIVFFDATDNKLKSEGNSDFLTAIAGAGLSVSSNKLVTQAGSVTAAATNGGGVLSEGYNYLAAAVTASVIVSLPNGGGGAAQVGDVITLKAKDGVTDSRYVELRRQGSDTIDGQIAVRIESPYGAISVVYVAANDWRIV